MQITIQPNAVAKIMLSIIGVLAFMHLTQMGLYYYIDDRDVFTWIKLLDFDYEGNLPSLYSATAILFSAMLLAVITVHNKRAQQPYKAWLGLCLIFIFLALDEGASIHEKIGDLTEEYYESSGYFYYEWLISYLVLLAIFLVSYVKFLFTIPKTIAIQFVIAGVMFVSGAVGFEMLGAEEADINNTNTVKYSILYTTEELLEMTAIVVFVHALLKYIQLEVGAIQLSFETKS